MEADPPTPNLSTPKGREPDPELREVALSECQLIHWFLFTEPCPPEIAGQYAELYAAHFGDPANRALSRLLIKERIDIEAVEFVLRFWRPGNPVSRRVASLSYLCEGNRAYFNQYINERNHFLTGKIAIAVAGLSAVYKGLKGLYLIKRYGIGC